MLLVLSRCLLIVGKAIKDTRAREEIRALVRRRECGLFRKDSGTFLCFFLLAQEGEPLLSRIHGYDHKQTKQQKEKNHWA